MKNKASSIRPLSASIDHRSHTREEWGELLAETDRLHAGLGGRARVHIVAQCLTTTPVEETRKQLKSRHEQTEEMSRKSMLDMDEFNQLSPRQKLFFCQNGGKLIE